MTDLRTEYDCLVMGGGPAGSTVAALVAEAGFSTLVVEREQMPRPHVGESLMPETYWIFERLGVLDRLKASSYAKKVGVQFVNNTGKESTPFFFRTHDDRESSDSWHVDRAHFDKMLFENAAAKGATCRDNTRVLDIGIEKRENGCEQVTGVQLQHGASAGANSPAEIKAKVIVDATGQQAMLANRLGVRKENPSLRKAAIWQHYRGAQRDESGGGVKTVIMHTENKESWFWYIPQANDIVSVGVVGDRDDLLKGRGTPQEVFLEEQAKCSTLTSWLADARPEGELKISKEFSYSTERSAGDGWVLVGDAWGFIDPIYSSGVYFALKSGALAADCVIEGLQTGDTSAAVLGRWVPEFTRQTGLIRKLVYAFYSGEFRVGKFIQEHPQHQSELVDLLIGRVFDGCEGKIFDDLAPWIESKMQSGGRPVEGIDSPVAN